MTAVSVAGTVVTITVLADGPSICDPAETGQPPDTVNWPAPYDFRAEYTRRVQATIRIYYESYIFGAKWKRFGGRKAIGYGKLRLDYCRPGDNCPQNGKRIRLVATKPDYCTDSGKIEYLRLSGHLGKLEWFGGVIRCSE